MTYARVHGPDVSLYQDSPETAQQINFQKMKAAGASFVIVRAGQNKWVDPDFSYNIIQASLAGLPRGAYFFYDSRVCPEEQAYLFLSLVKGLNLELGIWLDLEENYRGEYKGWINWKKCLNVLRASAPRVGIYTGPSYWMTNRPTGKADLDYFASFPLWIANYGVLSPMVPSPWKSWVFWQWGTPVVGHEYGAESLEIDMNYFNGDAASFAAFAGKVPQQEGQVMRYKAVNLFDNMRLRSGSNTAAGVLGTYTHGQTFEGDNLFVATARLSNASGVFQEIGDTWLEVKTVNGVAKSGWVAIVHLGREYCTLTDNNPPEPEPTTEYIIHVKDGISRKFIPE